VEEKKIVCVFEFITVIVVICGIPVYEIWGLLLRVGTGHLHQILA
jgi:hypothetical protein